MRLAILLTNALFICMLNTPASATVLYSNLDASNGFNSNNAWGYANSNAMQFSPTTSGIITSADLALSYAHWSLDPYIATISLYSSSDSGSDPGLLLESTTVNVTNPFGNSTLTSVLFSGSTTLTSGQFYWVKASDSNGGQLWHFNNIGVEGYFSQNGQSPGNNILGAFRINSTSTTVPEPSALALVALGIGMMLIKSSKRSS